MEGYPSSHQPYGIKRESSPSFDDNHTNQWSPTRPDDPSSPCYQRTQPAYKAEEQYVHGDQANTFTFPPFDFTTAQGFKPPARSSEYDLTAAQGFKPPARSSEYDLTAAQGFKPPARKYGYVPYYEGYRSTRTTYGSTTPMVGTGAVNNSKPNPPSRSSSSGGDTSTHTSSGKGGDSTNSSSKGGDSNNSSSIGDDNSNIAEPVLGAVAEANPRRTSFPGSSININITACNSCHGMAATGPVNVGAAAATPPASPETLCQPGETMYMSTIAGGIKCTGHGQFTRYDEP